MGSSVGTRVVGIDLGERRIGVSVSDSQRVLATPHSVIARSGDMSADRQAIAELAWYNLWSCGVRADLVIEVALDPHRLGQRRLRQPERLHEFLDQDFANRRRLSLGHQHGSPHS